MTGKKGKAKLMTGVLEERVAQIGGTIKDEGGGYRSLIGSHMGPLAYVELPKGHPDIGKGYDDFYEDCKGAPDVNGGLTFASGRVFGWDYAHAYNRGTPESDIKNALEFFRAREADQDG